MFGPPQPDAVELDESDAATFDGDGLPEPPGELVRVRPYKDTIGYAGGKRLLRAINPDPDLRDTTPTFAWEWWFAEGEVTPYLLGPSPGRITDAVYSHYPNSSAQTIRQRFPTAQEGEYVAGGRLQLALDCIFPIRHRESRTSIEEDPYTTLLPALMGADHEQTVLQVAFRPVSPDWFTRGWLGSDGDMIAESVGQGRVVGQINPRVVQTQSDRDGEADITAQSGEPAFQAVARVFALSGDPERAIERVLTVADAFDEFQNPINHDRTQEFDLQPYSRKDVLPAVSRGYQRHVPQRSWFRRVLSGQANVLTISELEALCHFPNEEINLPALSWTRMESGPGVPASNPQYQPPEDDADA